MIEQHAETTGSQLPPPDEQAVMARLETQVALLHRRLVVRAAAWAATAAFAVSGWVLLAVLAVARLVPEAAVAVPLLGQAWFAPSLLLALVLLAGVAAARAAVRVRPEEAVRLLDRALVEGRFTVYTAWEHSSAPDAEAKTRHVHPALLAALRRHLAKLLQQRRERLGNDNNDDNDFDVATRNTSPLPGWRKPSLALLALTWLALSAWFAVALPATSSTAGQADNLRSAEQLESQLHTVRSRATERGDDALAEAAASLHTALQRAATHADEDGLAAALARAERLAEHRRAELERHSMFLDAVEQAQQALADGEFSEADWEKLRAELTEAAAATNRQEALAALDELALEDAADALAELAATEREARDSDAALDARWQAILDEIAEQRRQQQQADVAAASSEPGSPRERTSTDSDASRERDETRNNEHEGNGTGHLRPDSTPQENNNDEPSVVHDESPLLFDLSGTDTGEAQILDPQDTANLAPHVRPLALRLVHWQQQQRPSSPRGNNNDD